MRTSVIGIFKQCCLRKLAGCCPCSKFLLSPWFWYCWEVSSALHSLVTAFLQGSQAWDGGTAPRSGLGDGGVSQETEHKYGDPNSLITSGAITSRISKGLPWCLCVKNGSRWVSGDWMVFHSVWIVTASKGLDTFAIGHVRQCALLVCMQNFVFSLLSSPTFNGGNPTGVSDWKQLLNNYLFIQLLFSFINVCSSGLYLFEFCGFGLSQFIMKQKRNGKSYV